ncbi:reverse transcriptase domain-containing protein [Tanacetum coccineum]
MITTSNKMEGRKPSRLMETIDIMDLIPFVGSVLYITQDLALSDVRIVIKQLMARSGMDLKLAKTDEMPVDMPGALATDDTELGRQMTKFTSTVRQDTDEIYTRDRRAHARTARLIEAEARMSREAWGRSMDASDLARTEETSGDYRDVGGRPQETGAVHRGTETAEETSDSDDRKMAQKRATRSNVAPETTNTTSVTNAQLQAMINQGVTAALAAREADRNTNGDDSHISGAVALTWWNTHVKTVGHDAAYGMPWKTLMKMMTDKYCPQNEIKKLEIEIWDLKVKGTNLTSYTQRFQELALLCGRMFPEESDKIKKYVGGLPDMIHENVVVSKPKTMQDAVEIATELMDKKIQTFVERQTESKRKSMANANNANNHKGTGSGQKPTCYECGVQGHFKRECPKIKNNNNCGNQVRGGNAPAKVYAVGHAGTNPDSNVVTGTFLLNNHYASVLFDTGADRSFVSTAFSS